MNQANRTNRATRRVRPGVGWGIVAALSLLLIVATSWAFVRGPLSGWLSHYAAASDTTDDNAAREGNGEVPPIDAAAPEKTETATFALGCFWHPDSQFGVLPGVVRTRVGYAGGTKVDPTYHDLGNHAETIQIDFDPEKITYEQLLDSFFTLHNPCTRSFSSLQYRSAIFVHGDEQRKAAEAAKEKYAAKEGRTVLTAILPAGKFYLAEDYHQKYLLKRKKKLYAELACYYPNESDFINSTAVARACGYIDGNGTAEALEAEIDSLGLSDEAKEILRGEHKARTH